MTLTSGQWSAYVTGEMSAWISPDSPNDNTRVVAELAFDEEVRWAAHLGISALVLPARMVEPPHTNAARCATEALEAASYLQLWASVPLVAAPLPEAEGCDGAGPHGNAAVHNSRGDSWEWWNDFRRRSGSHANLGVALTLTAKIPEDPAVLERWYGEPVRAVYVPYSTFVPNSTGFPALPKGHQNFLKRMYHQGAAVYLTGRCTHPEGNAAPLRYLQHLYDKLVGSLSEEDLQHSSYLDYLQAPLQPLADNLESQTYETFEKDPVKYENYEEAVYQALRDRVAAEPERVWVLMVVGAGRGPLVRASLRAGEKAGAKLRVYAVEKNPNAVITLRNMRHTHGWGDRVTIVSHDMRTWEAPEKADVLVSELLGSFGDNELSPECLDGAQKFLADDGISIPYDYTSYIAPLCSQKLHNEVRTYGDDKSWETGYVVQIHNAHRVAEPEPLFIFEHPNRDDPIDNTRYAELSFVATESELVHGVGGYFESRLYKDVMISILPSTHSPGMFSWFPIYFPIREPLYVSKGDRIDIAFWRRGDRRKVWYEWCISTPSGTSPIHNSRGRSSHISL